MGCRAIRGEIENNRKEIVCINEVDEFYKLEHTFCKEIPKDLTVIILNNTNHCLILLKLICKIIYKNFASCFLDNKKYTFSLDLTSLSIKPDLMAKTLSQIVYLVHFVTKSFINCVTFTLDTKMFLYKFPNKNLSCFSFLLLKKIDNSFIKENTMKMHHELFILQNEGGCVESTLQDLVTDINDLSETNYKGLILPPFSFTSVENLEEISKINFSFEFLELQLQVTLTNLAELGNLISGYFNRFQKVSFKILTLYFNNYTEDKIEFFESKVVTIIEKLISNAFMENHLEFFALKLFFVQHENNAVDYKAYFFDMKPNQRNFKKRNTVSFYKTSKITFGPENFLRIFLIRKKSDFSPR